MFFTAQTEHIIKLYALIKWIIFFAFSLFNIKFKKIDDMFI